MHYCISVITDYILTEQEAQILMAPYNDDAENNDSGFTWDWLQVAGRYGALLKIKYKPEYDYMRERNGVIFYNKLIDRLLENKQMGKGFYFENDTYAYLGACEGYLLVDSAKIDDDLILGDFEGYGFLDETGLHVREKWDGEHFNEDGEYSQKFKDCISRNAGKFITVIDCHD